MTMVTNVSNRTLCLGGVTLGPREMDDVNVPARKLANHLFVRSGLVEVSGLSAPAPAPTQEPEEPEQSESEEDGGEEAAGSDEEVALEEMDRDQLAEYAREHYPDLFIGNKGRERLLSDILEDE